MARERAYEVSTAQWPIVRLRPDLHKKLQEIAKEDYRSMTGEVSMIIEKFIDEREGRISQAN